MLDLLNVTLSSKRIVVALNTTEPFWKVAEVELDHPAPNPIVPTILALSREICMGGLGLKATRTRDKSSGETIVPKISPEKNSHLPLQITVASLFTTTCTFAKIPA